MPGFVFGLIGREVFRAARSPTTTIGGFASSFVDFHRFALAVSKRRPFLHAIKIQIEQSEVEIEQFEVVSQQMRSSSPDEIEQ